MEKKERVQHEGVIKSISTQTLEILIVSRSACAACHAKSACGIADMQQKTITVQRSEGEFHVGDQVMVYASMNHAVYSVILAYIIPSMLILAAIFLLERSGSDELQAAVISLIFLSGYFFILYLLRNKISKQIKFTIEKIDNY